jgi:hypothetical protein
MRTRPLLLPLFLTGVVLDGYVVVSGGERDDGGALGRSRVDPVRWIHPDDPRQRRRRLRRRGDDGDGAARSRRHF